jgi:hypothetical protein
VVLQGINRGRSNSLGLRKQENLTYAAQELKGEELTRVKTLTLLIADSANRWCCCNKKFRWHWRIH